MSDYEGHQRPGDTVTQQDAHEDLIEEMGPAIVDAQMRATSAHAAIPDLAAPSAGYVEAEALAARNKINEILAVLRDAELIPAS